MARIELSNIGGGGTTLSLTTTGTSGASTLAGSVLNIPVYQGQLTLTTTGTSGAATLVGDTLNIPNYATGGNPAGSAGQVQFNSTPSGSFAASANLAWDNTAVQLNINDPASPTGKLNVKGSGATSSTVNTRLTDSGNTELLKVLDNGSTNIGANFNWDNVNSRLGLGTSTPNQTLEVSGAMRLTGTAGTASFMLGRNSAGDVSTVVLGTTGTSGAATLSANVLNIPQYQGAVSLTTSGTSGASTFAANVLNIPQYQGALTLSTAGTTGASTLVGNTLTIPTYQGQISLTTTGTSGASTFVGNTLNIPTYQGAISLTTTGTSGAATLVGNTLNVPQYSTAPAGSTGEIQYNNAGAFGASANLSWDNSNVRLNINAPASPTGKLNVRGGGTTSSTVNLRLTDSGNTELFKVLDNGSTNIGADFNWDNTNSRLGIGTSSPTNDISVVKNVDGSARISITNQSAGTSATADLAVFNSAGAFTFQVTGTGNTVLTPNQGRFRSSTGIANGFTFLTGAPAPISFGTQDAEGMRLASGNRFLVGTTIDDGVSRVQVSGAIRTRGTNPSGGTNALLVQNSTPSDIYKIENNGKITYWATNTAAGTTGAQTINRPSGTVNFGIGATSLVVTNSLCTTASLVFAEVRTNDATATIKNVVPGSGSFTINLGAAATAETSVGFFIIN